MTTPSSRHYPAPLVWGVTLLGVLLFAAMLNHRLNPPREEVPDNRSEFYQPGSEDMTLPISHQLIEGYDIDNDPCDLLVAIFADSLEHDFTLILQADDADNDPNASREYCSVEARVDEGDGRGFVTPEVDETNVYRPPVHTGSRQGGTAYHYNAAGGDDFRIVYRVCDTTDELTDADCTIVLLE